MIHELESQAAYSGSKSGLTGLQTVAQGPSGD